MATQNQERAAADAETREPREPFHVVEYDSDTEERSIPLAMRRTEASDDEGEYGEDQRGRGIETVALQGFSGHELEDDEGAPPLEDEEEEDMDEDMDENGEIVAEEEIEEEEYGEEDYDEEEEEEDVGEGIAGSKNGGIGVLRSGREIEESDGNQVEEGKKDPEPFAVPTAGAFYMHDDRFRDNGSARPRRMPGRRKLWEAKDDKAWVHDRFEELNLEDEEIYQRRGRGRFRGRGRGRGMGRGRGRFGGRSRMYSDNSSSQYVRRGSGRGRGTRREAIGRRNLDGFTIADKQAPRNVEAMSNGNFGRRQYRSQMGNGQQDRVNEKKNVVSSLNSASPPFYPSGVQNQNHTMPVKKEQQAGAMGNMNAALAKTEERMGTLDSSSSSKNTRTTVNATGQAQPSADQSMRPFADKQSMPVNQAPKSSSSNLVSHHSTRKASVSGDQPFNQSNTNGNNISRSSGLAPADGSMPQRNIQNQSQGGNRVSSQYLPQPATSANPSNRSDAPEGVESVSSPSSSKSKASASGRVKANPQGGSRGSPAYNGSTPTSGTSGIPMSEQSFTHTPALLPVMSLGGQHPGLGVPAVGMALPGYVAQPQLGFGNSEMAWVPLFAGAAGALGATYCPPYIAVDGNYYAQSSGQSTLLGTSGRDSSGNKSQNSLKQPSRSETTNDEFGQRQNKPRRYSEMNFGQ
eukprot:TRINITY_DN3410_c0_g1_i2.p1 TRINITY_DN3410_c0_g1~~TRINITY_DN3410_c0_g1_i2.p1  ORF type:complete len:688 (+),score=175.34 TRINITY_DN3410_c0_g1_i2:114-2177(+)